MDMGLAERVVLVTGATAHIGRAIALAFAAEGARVVVSGRDAAQGAAVVAAAMSAGAADAYWAPADLLHPDQVAEMAGRVLERFDGIDVLVNNTGGNATIQPFAESDPDDWRYDIDINLTSMLRVTRAFLPRMLERKTGRIINISSTAGVVGDPFIAVYSAAKAAVLGFTRVLASEVGAANITVNAIAPFGTLPDSPETLSSGSRWHPTQGLFNTLPPEQAALLQTLVRRSALPRLTATPDEIGAAAVYLASRHAGFITGEVLHVEGGVRLGWTHPDLAAGADEMKADAGA